MILLNMIFFYGQMILHCIYTIFSLSIHLLVGPKTDSTTCLLQVFLLYTALDTFKNMPRSRIPTSHCISMFHLFFMVVINTDQKPTSFHSSYSITERSQSFWSRQELNQKSRRSAAYWLIPHWLVQLACLYTQNYLPRGGTTYCGLPSINHSSRKCLPDLPVWSDEGIL